MDKEVKKVFTPKPMISFRSARKLSNYLLRPKMYPIDRNVRSKNCNSKRCEVSKNVNEASTLTSTFTGEIFTINYKFYCNARCLLTCRKYKIKHVGQTVINFAQDGITTKVIPRHLAEEVIACNNICLITSIPLDMLAY